MRLAREALLAVLGDFHFDCYVVILQVYFFKAIHFVSHYHKNRFRKSGQRYLEHDCRLARMALAMKLPIRCIVALLLHEAVEDDGKTLDWLLKYFDNLIAKTVIALSKAPKTVYSERSLRVIKSIEIMVYAIADGNWYVAINKLIDRHDNTTDTSGLSDIDKQRLFEETEDYFLPFFRWAEQFIPERYKAGYRMLVIAIENACDNYWRTQALPAK